MKIHIIFLKQCILLILLCCITPSVCAASPAYTMTVDNGFIAVWDHGSATWHSHSSIPVDMLTDQDQQLLQQGLDLSDEAALTRALEDFCS